jgi:hypothetical protein
LPSPLNLQKQTFRRPSRLKKQKIWLRHFYSIPDREGSFGASFTLYPGPGNTKISAYFYSIPEGVMGESPGAYPFIEFGVDRNLMVFCLAF